MIGAILQTSFRSLRRDRGAFVMSFVLPIGFFTIFGFVFGSMKGSSTPRVNVLVVDEDHSAASRSLMRALLREPSLQAETHAKPTKENPAPADYTAATAEAAVRSGAAPAAMIIPAGFGANPISFGPEPGAGAARPKFRILHDSADPVAAQVVAGMLQKVVMTSLPATMAAAGSQYFDQQVGGLTPKQRQQMESSMAFLRQLQNDGGADSQDAPSGAPANNSASNSRGFVAVDIQDVVGARKSNPMIAYYAAGVGVMFLLFTSGAAGASLLDESDSGALDRVLSAPVTLMFLWAWLIFKLDLFTHIPGFLVMTAVTAFAVSAYGMLLASLTHTRGQLAAVSTLIVLTMSAVGGSMFPKFLMPDAMMKVGYFTFNSWAISGYTKVFWRDEPITSLGPEVAVLVASGAVLFLLARWFARKWEYV
jgi:ABC-2 type transport system permease protein